MSSPAEAILLRLKTHGPATHAELAAHLGVSRQAVRLQTERLAARGLVATGTVRSGVGRPGARWSLTAEGHAQFPDTHAQLTVELIEAVREEFGVPGLERLIQRREAATAAAYGDALANAEGLEARLERLAEIRTREGYMARWDATGDGAFVLSENHCPICAAAAACQGFCRAELQLFQTLLAPARVERIDHVLQGARRCAYLVTPP
ncbi:helix-turn-helix transcriptional regulator [Phenylobacterium sp.]|uniref:helix-turn-helix transcriptional regulator n=1 Tax=Phenylobacterium sp. TaxID=1871053 RepID=UPI002FDB557D